MFSGNKKKKLLHSIVSCQFIIRNKHPLSKGWGNDKFESSFFADYRLQIYVIKVHKQRSFLHNGTSNGKTRQEYNAVRQQCTREHRTKSFCTVSRRDRVARFIGENGTLARVRLSRHHLIHPNASAVKPIRLPGSVGIRSMVVSLARLVSWLCSSLARWRLVLM